MYILSTACICYAIHSYVYYILDRNRSCNGCITARLCMAKTGRYNLNFSMLFDQSLLNSPCELRLNNMLTNLSLTEEHCVELTSNPNYTIRCPICTDGRHSIYHVIPSSNEDCNNSGT